eukprot:365346-Chlamydomonas_euryale.AAC.9
MVMRYYELLTRFGSSACKTALVMRRFKDAGEIYKRHKDCKHNIAMEPTLLYDGTGLTAPSPLLDPLCLAALNTGMPFVSPLHATLTLTLRWHGFSASWLPSTTLTMNVNNGLLAASSLMMCLNEASHCIHHRCMVGKPPRACKIQDLVAYEHNNNAPKTNCQHPLSALPPRQGVHRVRVTGNGPNLVCLCEASNPR